MTLFLALLSAITAALGAAPNIPKALIQGVKDALAAISAIVSSGAISNPSSSTVLLTLAGVLTALKADPNLPTDLLSQIQDLEVILQQALAADAEAQKGVDAAAIKPITPQP